MKQRIAVMLLAIVMSFCASFVIIKHLTSYNRNPSSHPAVITQQKDYKNKILKEHFSNTDNKTQTILTNEFLEWIENKFGNSSLNKIYNSFEKGEYNSYIWYAATGNTLNVLNDMYKGCLDESSHNYNKNITLKKAQTEKTVIRIVGDFSLADNWHIAKAYDQRGKGLEGILSKDAISLLKNADITLLNNEFCFSNRGTALSGKAYTFVAKPSRAAILNDLGVDIVSLANNHAYDYGKDAFLDTLDTLSSVKVAYIGGGKNEKEASEAQYFIVNGVKIAFVAATRAEKNILTPEATDTSPGVLRTYNSEKFCKAIKKAKEQSDYCIAYVHWGKEYSHDIEEGLRQMGEDYINSGADIVVGAHAHILQGIEFYNGKPIVYNLGNFIFNSKTLDSGILELSLDGLNPEFKFIPCVQENCRTRVVTDQNRNRILEFMKAHSKGVIFETDGSFKAE